ncbi:MAG: VTT domain-containing protein [Bacteroidia bacterium]|nr:VTT domain-containing protein [Bacteroidia bacterium]
MIEFLKTLTDPNSIIQYGGIGLLLFVIFAETGLFVGFFLPGDNLILLAGIICRSKPELLSGVPFGVLLLLMMAAAILGNCFGYWFGLKSGDALFKKEDTFFFKKSRLELARKYYEKYGGNLALIIARFLPVVRTFAPILAGAIKVNFFKFMIFNIAGSVIWIGTLATLGFYLVYFFPQIGNYLGYIFVFLIVITALPLLKMLISNRKKA